MEHKCKWGISLILTQYWYFFPQTYVIFKGFRKYFLVKQLYLICSEYNYIGETDRLILLYVALAYTYIYAQNTIHWYAYMEDLQKSIIQLFGDISIGTLRTSQGFQNLRYMAKQLAYVRKKMVQHFWRIFKSQFLPSILFWLSKRQYRR